MYEVAVEVRFDAAHRLLRYKGKCRNIHGHSYVAVARIRSTELERRSPGFVMDFGVLKRIFGDWIDEHWDHTLILNESDPLLDLVQEQECKVFGMKGDPTAERMAKHLYKLVCSFLDHRTKIDVVSVTIWETETSSATYRSDKGD